VDRQQKRRQNLRKKEKSELIPYLQSKTARLCDGWRSRLQTNGTAKYFGKPCWLSKRELGSGELFWLENKIAHLLTIRTKRQYAKHY